MRDIWASRKKAVIEFNSLLDRHCNCDHETWRQSMQLALLAAARSLVDHGALNLMYRTVCASASESAGASIALGRTTSSTISTVIHYERLPVYLSHSYAWHAPHINHHRHVTSLKHRNKQTNNFLRCASSWRFANEIEATSVDNKR